MEAEALRGFRTDLPLRLVRVVLAITPPGATTTPPREKLPPLQLLLLPELAMVPPRWRVFLWKGSIEELKVGDTVEYPWGRQGEWYKCRLVLLQDEGTSREAELEFLPQIPRKTKGVRCCPGIVKVTGLVQDGDLALPGIRKPWD
eukprot:g16038.t1